MKQHELSNCSKLKAILRHRTVLVPRFQQNMLDSLRILPALHYSSLKLRRASILPMSDSQTLQSKLNKRLGSLVTEERSLFHCRLLSTIGVPQKPPSHLLERPHLKLTAIRCVRIPMRQNLQQVAGLL